MAEFKLLVIDDDSTRKQGYETLLNDSWFEVSFCFEKEDFFRLAIDKFDCAIIDISLDNWTDESSVEQMFYTVVSSIGTSVPIVLISSKIEEVVQWTFDLYQKSYKILYTTAIEQFDEDGKIQFRTPESPKIICHNIARALVQYKKASLYRKGMDDDINILHISDLQFGDGSFNSGLAYSFPESLKSYLDEKLNTTIDFIVITGDIAFSGAPSEYDAAYLWLDSFCNLILGTDNYHERVLICPGNHDVNLSISVLNDYSYKFPEEGETRRQIKVLKRKESLKEYINYSLDPFRDFAYKLTRDVRWLDKLSFINRKFELLGIRFIHLNLLAPYEQLGRREAQFSVDRSAIGELNKELQDTPSNLRSIFLTHPSPSCIGFNLDSYGTEDWQALSSMIINSNARLFLYGHTHTNTPTTELPLSANRFIIGSGVGTLFVKPTGQGEVNSFKIIKLNRESNRVVDYLENHYMVRPDASISDLDQEFSSTKTW